MFQLRSAARRDDSGVAIVAAMGVAFVVMALLVILVALTISASNGSSRERERTAGIHSTEGALDATMAELENATPCGAPSFSPIEFGDGTQATSVAVEITYYAADFTTVISCSGGVLASDPSFAIIRAESTPLVDGLGSQPSRILEARLALESRGGSTKLPGIYAARDMWFEGTPDVFSQVDDGNPDIWIESGDLTCRTTTNRQLEIEAEVVVAHGNASIQEYCWFDRGLWVDGNTTFTNTSASSGSEVNLRCNNHYLCGDFVTGGNLNLNQTTGRDITAAGDVLVGGTINRPDRLSADGAVLSGDPDVAEERAPRPFPSVQYVRDNWFAAYSMTEGLRNDFFKNSIFIGATNSQINSMRSSCTIAPSNSGFRGSVVLPATPMVYDLRECNGVAGTTTGDVLKSTSSVTITVNADTAFMVSGFFNSGTLNFVSGDGLSHNVWIIVPDQSVPAYGGSLSCTAATLYNLCSTNILTSTSHVPIMWYTKHLFYSDGKSASVNDMYGQMFAGSVVFRGYLDLQFETLTVPGEILWVPGESGFDVQLLSKSESSNS